jgi:hypothetical protein
LVVAFIECLPQAVKPAAFLLARIGKLWKEQAFSSQRDKGTKAKKQAKLIWVSPL